MTNKQELINWMTEKRENLTFESKVQLIWDYWKNKDAIPDLQKDVANWKDACEIEKTQNKALNQDLTQKNDRIFQLNSALKGSSIILKKQIAYTIKLEEQLKTEKNDKNTSQEQAQHLQEDIERLAKERQTIENKVKELETEETKNKDLRDKELEELKKEKDEAENYVIIAKRNWNGFIKNIKNILKFESDDPALILEEIKKRETALNTANAELAKEKGWWDKWMLNSEHFILADAVPNVYGGKIYLNPPKESNMTRKRWFLTSSGSEIKKLIKEYYYQYYRDK